MKRRNTNGVSRAERLNGEFQKEISEIISKKLKNPLVEGMVSVMEVITSRDLSHAKVYLSVYTKTEEQRLKTFEAIKNDAKKVRYELGKVMMIRTIPEIDFVLDNSIAYGDKMDKLFLEIKKGEKIDNN